MVDIHFIIIKIKLFLNFNLIKNAKNGIILVQRLSRTYFVMYDKQEYFVWLCDKYWTSTLLKFVLWKK